MTLTPVVSSVAKESRLANILRLITGIADRSHRDHLEPAFLQRSLSRTRGLFILFGLLSLVLSPASLAQPLRIVCSEIAPYCFTENGVRRGYIYEIGLEIQRRLGQPSPIEIQPLARSMRTVTNGGPVISLWMGRIPERENLVRWITPVLHDAFYIYTLKGRADASTIERARELGLLAATIAGANASYAQHLALPEIDATTSEESNGKKLLAGRVNGWISTDTTFSYFLLTQKRTREEFVQGVKLSDYTAYIAASREIDEVTAQQWALTYQSLLKDGYVKKIMEKYGITDR